METLQQAMRGGVVDYLLKPVMFPRLETALRKYQMRQAELKQLADFDQQKVDKMFTTHSSEALPQRLPKGIDAVTLDKIRLLFQTATMLTADEAGEKLGLAAQQPDAILSILSLLESWRPISVMVRWDAQNERTVNYIVTHPD